MAALYSVNYVIFDGFSESDSSSADSSPNEPQSSDDADDDYESASHQPAMDHPFLGAAFARGSNQCNVTRFKSTCNAWSLFDDHQIPVATSAK